MIRSVNITSDIKISFSQPTKYRTILPDTLRPKTEKIEDWKQDPTQLTPKKYYPIKKEDGKYRVIWTPSAKDQTKIIYAVKNVINQKLRYNGLTKRKAKIRIGEHLWKASKNDSKMTKFHRALSENPENFVVGIYPIKDTTTSLGDKERHIIKLKNSVLQGYNSNSGGAEGSICRVLSFI